MRDSFIKKLELLAEKDDRIFLLVGDLGYGVIDRFAKRFPNQFLNAGISEQNMMGMASGLAHSGYKVFVYSIANFPTLRCLEQIRNDVSYHGYDVTIVSIGAGFGYGTLGYSHFALEDLSILRSLPNLNIFSPGDSHELEATLDHISRSPGPNYLRVGKNGEALLVGETLESPYCGRELSKGNGRFAVLTTGNIGIEVSDALLQIPEKRRLEISHYSIPSLAYETLNSIDLIKFEKIVTVEEHRLAGGFGSFVLEYFEKNNISVPIRRIGIEPDVDFPIGSQNYLKKIFGLSSDEIASKINGFLF